MSRDVAAAEMDSRWRTWQIQGLEGDRRRATLKLFRFMSDFREGMWGVVQAGVSELDFDFRDYAQKHFDRLEKARTDPRFKGWIEEARS